MAVSWAPVDLSACLDGSLMPAFPSMLHRSDGVALLYDGKVHSAYGEPEGCKGWLACLATADQLRRGLDVLYFDFEDEPATLVSRLLALGVSREQLVAHLHYVRPEEAISEAAWAALARSAERAVLAIVDGFNEALALHGLDSRDNTDISTFNRTFIRPLQDRGEKAILELDHVTKDKETRSRYAIGAQQKLGLVDVAYSLHVIQPFGRGREGRVAIKVRKDRPGHIRTHQGTDGQIATMVLESDDDGSVRISLEPPQDAGESFRPTFLMERVSRAIEETPGIGKRAIRDAVKGRNSAKDRALELLIAEEYVAVEPNGTGLKHTVRIPFREAESETDRAPGVPRPISEDRAHRAPACPSGAPGVPGELEGECAHVPSSCREGARGTVPLAAAFDDEEAGL